MSVKYNCIFILFVFDRNHHWIFPSRPLPRYTMCAEWSWLLHRRRRPDAPDAPSSFFTRRSARLGTVSKCLFLLSRPRCVMRSRCLAAVNAHQWFDSPVASCPSSCRDRNTSLGNARTSRSAFATRRDRARGAIPTHPVRLRLPCST